MKLKRACMYSASMNTLLGIVWYRYWHNLGCFQLIRRSAPMGYIMAFEECQAVVFVEPESFSTWTEAILSVLIQRQAVNGSLLAFTDAAQTNQDAPFRRHIVPFGRWTVHGSLSYVHVHYVLLCSEKTRAADLALFSSNSGEKRRFATSSPSISRALYPSPMSKKKKEYIQWTLHSKLQLKMHLLSDFLFNVFFSISFRIALHPTGTWRAHANRGESADGETNDEASES